MTYNETHFSHQVIEMINLLKEPFSNQECFVGIATSERLGHVAATINIHRGQIETVCSVSIVEGWDNSAAHATKVIEGEQLHVCLSNKRDRFLLDDGKDQMK